MSGENSKPKRGRPRGSKKKNPLDDLNARQTLYVKNKLQGKSDYQAAIQAGYSHATAIACGKNIEGPAVRRAFQQLLHQKVPLEKLANRAAEMLDATKVSRASFEGRFFDKKVDVDYVERRRGLELFAQMADVWNPKVTTEVEQIISEETAKALLRIPERMPLPSERLDELSRSYVPLQRDNHTNFGDKALLLEAQPDTASHRFLWRWNFAGQNVTGEA